MTILKSSRSSALTLFAFIHFSNNFYAEDLNENLILLITTMKLIRRLYRALPPHPGHQLMRLQIPDFQRVQL